MWNRLRAFVLTYTALSCLLNAVLYLMAEKRPDAYISTNILAFYTTYALYRPLKRASPKVKLLHVAMLTLFLAIAVYRVYRVVVR